MDIAKQSTKPGTMIQGIAASEALDSSGERLSIEGLDITTLEEGRGLLNYEHKSDTPASIVGKIVYAKKIFSDKDCTLPEELMFWDKIKTPYLYIQAELFDGAGHDQAKEVAAMLRYDDSKKKQGDETPPVVNFSVEGAKINKDEASGIVTHSIAKKVSVTVAACNKQSIAQILHPKDEAVPSAVKKSNKKFDTLFKSETPVELFKSAPVSHVKSQSEPKVIGHTESGKPVESHKKPGNYSDFGAKDHADAMNAHYDHALNSKNYAEKAHHIKMAQYHGMARERFARNEQQLKDKVGVKRLNMEKSMMGAAPGTLTGMDALQKEKLKKKVIKSEAPPVRRAYKDIQALTGVGKEIFEDKSGKQWRFEDGNQVAHFSDQNPNTETYADVVHRKLKDVPEKGVGLFEPKEGQGVNYFYDGMLGAMQPKVGNVENTLPADTAKLAASELAKGKNAKEQKAKVWGTTSQPSANSAMREKHSSHIKDFAEKRYGLGLKDSGGKWDVKAGKRKKAKKDIKVGVDKPDWRSGQLEAQANPDAQTHELGHLEILPEGVSLPEGQQLMDRQYGDVQKEHGYMKQKRSQYEVQPMAMENPLRRRMGLPANESSVPVKSGEGPRTAVEDGSVIGTRITKPSGKVVDLIRQARFASPENRERMDMIDRGELKFDPKSGWSPAAQTLHGKINAKAREKAKDLSRKDAKTLMRSEIETAYEQFGKSEQLMAVIAQKHPEASEGQKEALAKMIAYRMMKSQEEKLNKMLESIKEDSEE